MFVVYICILHYQYLDGYLNCLIVLRVCGETDSEIDLLPKGFITFSTSQAKVLWILTAAFPNVPLCNHRTTNDPAAFLLKTRQKVE